MASGAISSLGIGSNGTLSYDIIDQLKEADQKSMVKPIENNLVKVNAKQTALETLRTSLDTFESSVEKLSSEVLFAQRDVSVNGDSVSASVQAGAGIQDMDIEVTQLAKKDVHETAQSYSSMSDTIASGATFLELSLPDETITLEVDENTTLENLQTMINEKAGDSVSTSILNIGGDNPYKLIVKSDLSGADNKISLTEVDASGVAVDPASKKIDTEFSRIQEGVDAQFKYNGVDITRSSNNVDDLLPGVTINLLKENDPGETSTIEITQDLEGLNSKVQSFVDEYNGLMSTIDKLTNYNEDTGESGLFLGENTINKLRTELTSILTYTSGDANSLQNYGISLKEDGKIEYDRERLEEVLNGSQEEIDKMSQIFVGSYEEINGEDQLVDGVFAQFTEKISNYTDFSTGIFKFFGEQLTNEAKALEKERLSAVESLNVKYEMMANRFAAYDSQIASMNSSFSALQMQIDQAVNSK